MLSIQQRPFPINRTTLIAVGIVLVGFTGTLAVLKSMTSPDGRSANVRDSSSEQATPEATGTTTSSSKSTTSKESDGTPKENAAQSPQPATTEIQSTNDTWTAPQAPTNTQSPSSGTMQPARGQATESNTEPQPAPSSPTQEEGITDDTATDPISPILDPLQLPLGGWIFTVWLSNLK